MTTVTAYLVVLALAGGPVADVAACVELCDAEQAARGEDCMAGMDGLTAISDDSTACPVPDSSIAFIREDSPTGSFAPVLLVGIAVPAPLAIPRSPWTLVQRDRDPGGGSPGTALVLRL